MCKIRMMGKELRLDAVSIVVIILIIILAIWFLVMLLRGG